ncbi:uncharacterized protein K452DRAFT_327467 [Aplosporella prunicola CBS 121167]|uniref:Amine oxidase domain-containing protein n=1 Tax=Aplosporella prunicola CBS 121167 TaxID=1176127 RepID=A0A6A6BBA9_9PEZI|nr:uncharacterized protein K452DRAFT_327467 [Aplosporella prunicola CBS 121167]KAF2140643.1 hypothetical protein K452DRAFT_327467 [Aplosporella prunicola CBS 121167]
MQQDLLGSPHRQHLNGANGNGAMNGAALRRVLPRGRRPHVCVVGAGVSGLRCADVLLQAGMRVTILEARNRYGGRLCQALHQGHLVDLGPNWIHGTEDNPILDLAKETGTITHAWDGRQCVYNQQGEQLSEQVAAEAEETIWSIIGDAMAYSREHSASIPASKSLLDYIKEKTQGMYLNEKSDEKRRELLHRVAEMWGAFVGSPVESQSLKFFWLEECIDGENLFVAGTYKKILDKIAKPAVEGAEIKYEQLVKRIISGTNEEDSTVKVELADGQTLEFDEVVITTPLGWLKRNKEAFEPPLPQRLTEAIDSIGYGCLDKFYVVFPTAFWNEAAALAPVSNGADIPTNARNSVPNTTATTQPLRQPSHVESQNYHYPGFTQWTAPTYAPTTNPEAWSQECVNMAALPAPTAHPTLLFYTFGATSQHLASLLADEANPHAPRPATSAKLLAFFEPYYSRLPGYEAGAPACAPLSVLPTAWAIDPLAGYGSYCNFQTGAERADQDVETLRQGVPHRRLWFAGEHTASFLALGTVTGAYWSGEGVGRSLVRAYGGEGEK